MLQRAFPHVLGGQCITQDEWCQLRDRSLTHLGTLPTLSLRTCLECCAFRSHGGTPISVAVGKGKVASLRETQVLTPAPLPAQVIAGWDLALQTMCVGETCELICTPAYAYGDAAGPFPGQDLWFEVEVLSATQPDALKVLDCS